MKFDLETGTWEYSPPSLCSVGGSLGENTSAGSSQSSASNFQNPAFSGLAPNTAGQLAGLSNGLGIAQNNIGSLNPLTVAGMAGTYTPNPATNPLVAPVTDAQNSTLGQIGSVLGQTPGNLASAFGLLNTEASPGFASSLATSPETQAAIGSAIAPIRQQFNTQTVPGLQGSFTQAGQRVGSSSGQGSSAFDNAFATAQGGELANEGAIAGGIANNAYQTGLNIQANAPAQIGNLNATEMNTLISGLNAQALPQLTQQYGISAGTQLYQQQMNTILQALGLSVQGEQPVLGYSGSSQSFGQGTSGSAIL